MSVRQLCFAIGFATLAAACGERAGPAVDETATASTAPATAEAPATSSALTATAAPSGCDRPATPVATGEEIRGEIQATTAPYPANARYYCFTLPANVSEATVSLSGLTADLDLYVGRGSIDTVQGVDITAGETYQWKSNDFGAGNETVVISRPEPGTYYAEIVSYEGRQSPYVFSVR
jgi:hypothetical protein